MKRWLLALLALTALSIQTLIASHLEPGPTDTQSKLWLVGTSTLHAYSSTAHNMKVTFGFVSPIKTAIDQLKSAQLKTLDVSVPIKEMKSGKNQLDKNMQTALKADAYPDIVFHMETFRVLTSTIQSQGFPVAAAGKLTVAGVTKDVVLDGIITSEGADTRIQGVADLLMTDFGVKPPKLLMIKTANEVKVHYDLFLDEKGSIK